MIICAKFRGSKTPAYLSQAGGVNKSNNLIKDCAAKVQIKYISQTNLILKIMKKDYSNISERAKNGRNGVQLVYVLDCIRNSSRAADEGLTFESDADALRFFFDTFNEEFNHQYNKRRFPRLQERIGEYLRGLPSCFAVEYWNDEIIKIGLIWGVLDSTEGRKAEKFANDWFNMLGLRLLQAADKCKLNPYKYAV